jgi:hypothetical protein
MRQEQAFGNGVHVTDHALRRFAERADRVPGLACARLTDGEALRILEEVGYPVRSVRVMMAVHAEGAAGVGASGVRLDGVMLRMKGRSIVTCLPL